MSGASAVLAAGDRPDSDPLTLATELARVRQRGIAYIDRNTPRQQPVATPLLDRVLTQRLGTEVAANRALPVAQLLAREPTTFSAVSPVGGELLRALFFDHDGAAPGRSGPRQLRERVRRSLFVTDNSFNHIQRDHLIDFAAHLLRTTDGPDGS